MGTLYRAITEDGSAMACVLDATDIVAEIERIHQPSAVVTAALGRLSIAASMMGYQLKSESQSITLRLNGGGPAGRLIAVADASGNVKSCVDNPIVEIPLNTMGKLDVKGAVGTDGTLSVSRDLGSGEPYLGQIPIVSGEIAEDITYYYAKSEQIPTVCALGVLVNPDLTVRAAGGYLVQLLPFADESCIDVIEKNVGALPSISALLDSGKTPKEICESLLAGLSPQLLDESHPKYHCDCSRERSKKVLSSLSKEELEEILREDGQCEICCHFCTEKYVFGKDDLTEILAKK